MKFLALLMLTFAAFSVSAAYPVARPAHPFAGSRLYVPNDEAVHTSVVLLHGSEGGSEFYSEGEANVLVTQGYAVLVLCYFDCNRGMTGPRKTLKNVEANYVMDAVRWLRNRKGSNGKVVVYGFSRGAELTLLTGHVAKNGPDRPDGLIAHAPNDVVVGPYNHGWKIKACWLCIRGLGMCGENSPVTDFMWNPSCGDEDPNKMDFRISAWLVNGISLPSQTRIEIEKYEGPVMITVGEADEVWPADQTRRVEATLRAAGRSPEVHYFPAAGHSFRGGDEIRRRELVLDFLGRVH